MNGIESPHPIPSEAVSIRNSEFRRLMTVSGWNQSRAARELALDTGTISRYVNDEIEPSLSVLKLFSLVLGEPVRLPELESTARQSQNLTVFESELVSDIRTLDPSAREQTIGHFRGLIVALSNGPGLKKGTTTGSTTEESAEESGVDLSKVMAVAKASLPIALEKVRRMKLSKAVEPNEDKSGPKHAAPGRKAG